MKKSKLVVIKSDVGFYFSGFSPRRGTPIWVQELGEAYLFLHTDADLEYVKSVLENNWDATVAIHPVLLNILNDTGIDELSEYLNNQDLK